MHTRTHEESVQLFFAQELSLLFSRRRRVLSAHVSLVSCRTTRDRESWTKNPLHSAIVRLHVRRRRQASQACSGSTQEGCALLSALASGLCCRWLASSHFRWEAGSTDTPSSVQALLLLLLWLLWRRLSCRRPCRRRRREERGSDNCCCRCRWSTHALIATTTVASPQKVHVATCLCVYACPVSCPTSERTGQRRMAAGLGGSLCDNLVTCRRHPLLRRQQPSPSLAVRR